MIILQIYGQNQGQVLASTYPELAEQWNYEKNGNLTPWDVTAGVNRKVWWKCSLGHEWEATINNRALHGHGCPYCKGKKVWPGYNDMATRRPDMAADWDYELNDRLPSELMPRSDKKAWWICRKGHPSYYMSSNDRYRGHGCPLCGSESTKIKITTAVSKFSLDGSLLQTYPNVKEASKANGLSTSFVGDACRGMKKTCSSFVFRYPDKPPKRNNSVQVDEKVRDVLGQVISVGDEVMFVRNAHRRGFKVVRGTVYKITVRCVIIQTGTDKERSFLLHEGNSACLTKVLVMCYRPRRYKGGLVDASGYPVREGDLVVHLDPLVSKSKGFDFGIARRTADNFWEINGTRSSTNKIVVINW